MHQDLEKIFQLIPWCYWKHLYPCFEWERYILFYSCLSVCWYVPQSFVNPQLQPHFSQDLLSKFYYQILKCSYYTLWYCFRFIKTLMWFEMINPQNIFILHSFYLSSQNALTIYFNVIYKHWPDITFYNLSFIRPIQPVLVSNVYNNSNLFFCIF